MCSSDLVIDCRKEKKGYAFIATKGGRVDGHDYIEQVYQEGASCVICERSPQLENKPYILVEDSFQALKDIAKYYREQLEVKVVGITGSVGKTTTKEFISSVLEQNYCVLKTQGNFNNEVGLPLTVLQITEEHQVAVLEMGISDFGEMERLSKIAIPDTCVITNIGQCHLEFLGDRDGVLRAKTEMFQHRNRKGSICLNGDDDKLNTVREVDGTIPITFGLDPSNNIYAEIKKSYGLFGTKILIHTDGGSFEVKVPLPGQHMIYNALAATAVGLSLGLNTTQIQRGIETVQPIGGRSNLIQRDGLTIIDDCYNANPVSMKAALDLLALATTRKIAILGDMGELGDDKEKMHEEVGAYASTRSIDVLVCIGELCTYMRDACDSKNIKVFYFRTPNQAIVELKNIIEKNDTVLVKASRFMGLESIVKSLQE